MYPSQWELFNISCNVNKLHSAMLMRLNIAAGDRVGKTAAEAMTALVKAVCGTAAKYSRCILA
jgi:hypothetical protein